MKINPEDLELAVKMIKRGARPPIVTATVGLSKEFTRRLWHKIHQTKPPQGLCPDNSLGKLFTQRYADQASLFYLIYARHGEDVLRTADPKHIITAYDTFKKNREKAGKEVLLDFMTCWYIARDLRSLLLEVRFCRSCRLHHLYHNEITSLSSCPFCRASKQLSKKKITA